MSAFFLARTKRRGQYSVLLAAVVLAGCAQPTARNELLPAVAVAAPIPEPMSGGWGIDACLTAHTEAPERERYLADLAGTQIGFLRERGPTPDYARLKAAGFRVVSFVDLPNRPKVAQPGNILPEDLLEVFVGARESARRYAGMVDAWEMVGEPDVGYCTDLPERTVAFQKAFYLGLKAGAQEARRPLSDDGYSLSGSATHNPQPSTDHRAHRAPIVLMGALALPPGPWLHRAAANGLLDYTDAYNFHFYGHAEDLSGVIGAHREAIRRLSGESYLWSKHRPAGDTTSGGSNGLSGSKTNNQEPAPNNHRHVDMPLWITECGINAVKASDFLNPERRRLQAEFTVATARQALVDPQVAVFMPFILVHKDDPHALTIGAGQPLPAWTAYTEFTRRNPWPQRPLARPPSDINPIVLQWLPDNRTTLPHKVSGSYRFRGSDPIRGELRIYNFSSRPVRGRLAPAGLSHAVLEGLSAAELEVAPMARVTLPLTFRPKGDAPSYWREDWRAEFADESGRRSPLMFALETRPVAAAFREQATIVASTGIAGARHRFNPGDAVTSESGRWQGINGVHVEDLGSAAGAGTAATAVRVRVENAERDPQLAKLAVAKVSGLPSRGFIRLRLDQPMARGFGVCVDLVDRRGQRFTIWENFGASYFEPDATEIWLNLEDFHPYFWGRCSSDPNLRVEEVEEVQLRMYIARANDPRSIELSVMEPKG